MQQSYDELVQRVRNGRAASSSHDSSPQISERSVDEPRKPKPSAKLVQIFTEVSVTVDLEGWYNGVVLQ